jgi:hypothetical protein
MAEVVEFARQPDFKATETAVKADAAAPEEFAKALERLKIDVALFQEYYVPYLDTLEVFVTNRSPMRIIVNRPSQSDSASRGS